MNFTYGNIKTILSQLSSPILSIASYQYETYVDGSEVAVCLTAVDTFWPAFFFVGSISLFFLIPFCILVVLYTVIAKHLMDNPGIISYGHRSNILKYRKQVIFMLGAVVLSFFICLLPFRALTLWIIIVPPETIMSLGIDGYYNLLYFCRIMLYLNSAMNPVLYNLMSSKFRDGFLCLLGCKSFSRNKLLHGTRKGTFHTTSTNLSTSHSGDKKKDQLRHSERERLKEDNCLISTTIVPPPPTSICGNNESVQQVNHKSKICIQDKSQLSLLLRRSTENSLDRNEITPPSETLHCQNRESSDLLIQQNSNEKQAISKKNSANITDVEKYNCKSIPGPSTNYNLITPSSSQPFTNLSDLKKMPDIKVFSFTDGNDRKESLKVPIVVATTTATAERQIIFSKSSKSKSIDDDINSTNFNMKEKVYAKESFV